MLHQTRAEGIRTLHRRNFFPLRVAQFLSLTFYLPFFFFYFILLFIFAFFFFFKSTLLKELIFLPGVMYPPG